MKKLLIAIAICLLVPSVGWGATYYVDTAGTNDGDCGTAVGADACATLSYLVATRGLGAAGDNILIAAGSYTDNTAMSIPVGVHVHGASSATTTITTDKTKYIKLQSSVPVVDGSNEISGINLTASAAVYDGIVSSGRSNQKIHDMIFTGWTTYRGLSVTGKYGQDDINGEFYDESCSGGEPTCTWCSGADGVHTAPATTDWAEGIEIYDNTFVDSKLKVSVLKGANDLWQHL